jgi:hypothetical protein
VTDDASGVGAALNFHATLSFVKRQAFDAYRRAQPSPRGQFSSHA